MKELEEVIVALEDFNNRLEALEARQIDPDKPMTVQEAAAYLTISMSYLYRLTYQHKIPFHKPTGKLIYFLRAELNKWIVGRKKTEVGGRRIEDGSRKSEVGRRKSEVRRQMSEGKTQNSEESN